MRESISASTAAIRRSRCSTSPPGTYPGGIDATQAGYARQLYSLITGRVSAINGTYQWDGSAYNFNGDGGNGVIANGVGFFVSDSWRVKPNLTLTGGLRYEMVFPIKDNWGLSAPEDWTMVYGLTGAGSGNIGQGNLFKPGTLTGQNPVFKQYDNSNSAYKTDWNNVAPSVGAAWRPALGNKWLAMLLSDEPVIRGGYSMSFTKAATDFFNGIYGDNPGQTRPGSRSVHHGHADHRVRWIPAAPPGNQSPDAGHAAPAARPIRLRRRSPTTRSAPSIRTWQRR